VNEFIQVAGRMSGFIRLWIVVSVLWVGVVRLSNQSTIHDYYQCSIERAEDQRPDAPAWKRGGILVGGPCASHPPLDEFIASIVYPAAGVPAFLFAAGAAVRWVWRGFRLGRRIV
jgi:hypothetical protein